MPRGRPERALKRAVADLARLHPDDVEAILGALDPAERARIERLVAGDDAAEPASDPVPIWTYEGISPWLLERIEAGEGGDGPRREFVLITPASREALRAAAAPFRAEAKGDRRRATLLDRMVSMVAGART